MAISRWDPLNDMMSLRQAMDHLFEDAWVRPVGFMREGSGGGMLPLDLYETGDDFVVQAALPGVKPEDIHITTQGNMLRIDGELKREGDVKEEQYHLRERRFGRFHRDITLPTDVRADGVEAQFENGIL